MFGQVISSIDVQSIEPSDLKMRDSLMKSVQMAIEISTKSVPTCNKFYMYLYVT